MVAWVKFGFKASLMLNILLDHEKLVVQKHVIAFKIISHYFWTQYKINNKQIKYIQNKSKTKNNKKMHKNKCKSINSET